jgi:hypothetical protein
MTLQLWAFDAQDLDEHALQFGSFVLLLFGSVALAVLFGRLHPRPVGNERSRQPPAGAKGARRRSCVLRHLIHVAGAHKMRAKDCGCTLPSPGQLRAGEEGIRQRVLLETLTKFEGVSPPPTRCFLRG